MRFKRLSEEATPPKRATNGSAGYDLYSIIDTTIQPHETVMIKTGIAIALDDSNTVALIYARSGLSTNHGITLANCVGVVDSDYRGELLVALINQSNTPYHIKKGDRIAQMVLTPILTPQLIEVSELDQTNRGVGGYGSTGE